MKKSLTPASELHHICYPCNNTMSSLLFSTSHSLLLLEIVHDIYIPLLNSSHHVARTIEQPPLKYVLLDFSVLNQACLFFSPFILYYLPHSTKPCKVLPVIQGRWHSLHRAAPWGHTWSSRCSSGLLSKRETWTYWREPQRLQGYWRD